MSKVVATKDHSCGSLISCRWSVCRCHRFPLFIEQIRPLWRCFSASLPVRRLTCPMWRCIVGRIWKNRKTHQFTDGKGENRWKQVKTIISNLERLKSLKTKLEKPMAYHTAHPRISTVLQVSEEEASKICQGRHEDQLLKSYLLSEIRTSTPESKVRWRVKDLETCLEWRRLPATFCCFRFCF